MVPGDFEGDVGHMERVSMATSAETRGADARATIAQLLVRRGVRLAGAGGDPVLARARAGLSRHLWEEYRAFNPLRLALVREQPFHPMDPAQRRVRDALVAAGLLVAVGGGRIEPMSDDAERYLRGGWLEELAFCAVVAAGAEEAFFAQPVDWTVDGHLGRNEIDVIARRGDVLSFTSCKAVSPTLSAATPDRARLDGYVLESAYWDLHFADGHGRAMLLVATDLVDEQRDAARFPSVAGRARVLDVDLVGLDHGRWADLVAAYVAHWD
jgi:hypothetical protein